MLRRLAWCVLLVVLGAGCTCGPQGRIKPCRPRGLGATEIYKTGYVYRDAAGVEQYKDLRTTAHPKGEPIDPNTPQSFDHEVTLYIHDVEGGKTHDYNVVVGPDIETDVPSQFTVHKSAATVNISIGWAMLVGQLPVAESGLVSTSPEGTLMALVQLRSGDRYIYNLDPLVSQSVVKVKVGSDEKARLSPGQHVIVDTNNNVSPLKTTAPNDTYVAKMRARAPVAEFRATGCIK